LLSSGRPPADAESGPRAAPGPAAGPVWAVWRRSTGQVINVLSEGPMARRI